MSNKRRGRPCSNRRTIDFGTEELQEKRRALAAGDPILAESLLGVLYGRQLILQPHYEAGQFFGELGYRYEACLGQKFRQCSSILTHRIVGLQGLNPIQWAIEQDEQRTQTWYVALRALKQAGEMPYKSVLKVVFYDQDLYTMPITQSIIPFIKPLKQGLKVLELSFKGELKDGRGKGLFQVINPVRSTSSQPLLEGNQFDLPL